VENKYDLFALFEMYMKIVSLARIGYILLMVRRMAKNKLQTTSKKLSCFKLTKYVEVCLK
jgi:nitrate reductase gamma subunit